MTDFKAKLHQIRFRLGLRPRPCWGSLPSSCIWGRFAAGEGCWGRGGKRKGEGGGSGREGGKAPSYC